MTPQEKRLEILDWFCESTCRGENENRLCKCQPKEEFTKMIDEYRDTIVDSAPGTIPSNNPTYGDSPNHRIARWKAKMKGNEL